VGFALLVVFVPPLLLVGTVELVAALAIQLLKQPGDWNRAAAGWSSMAGNPAHTSRRGRRRAVGAARLLAVLATG
jgi:hypothetical protein